VQSDDKTIGSLIIIRHKKLYGVFIFVLLQEYPPIYRQ